MKKRISTPKPSKKSVTSINVDEKSFFTPLYNEVDKIEILYCVSKSKSIKTMYDILSFNGCLDPVSFRNKIKELYKTSLSELENYINGKPINKRGIIINNCKDQIRELKEKVLDAKYDSYEDISWPKRFINCDCIRASNIDGEIVPEIIENLHSGADEWAVHRHEKKVLDRVNPKNNRHILKEAESFVIFWLEVTDEMIRKLEYLEHYAPVFHLERKIINIKKPLIPQLAAFLKKYFPGTQDTELLAILSGDKVTTKAIFEEECTKLIDVFWCLCHESLSEPKLIEDGKKEIQQWIIDSFSYRTKTGATPKPFNPGTINNYLKNTHLRKCASPLEHIDELISSYKSNVNQ